MKVLKKIGTFFLLLLVLFSSLVLLCAFRPDVTEALAQVLYPDRNQGTVTVINVRDDTGQDGKDALGMGTPQDAESGMEDDWQADTPQQEDAYKNEGVSSQGNEAGQESAAEPSEAENAGAGLTTDINPQYIAPEQSDMLIPENVSGRNGYQQVQDEREQIEDEAAKALENQLGVGETGDGLIFDSVYYPYYGMLDEKGRHLYRQIYANANALQASFAPVEPIQASQLRNIFAAVYNDHPELFWMETVYNCKYRRDGQCVEINLKFNRTAKDLEQAKELFAENANAIINQAYYLASDFEKEKFIHDTLLERLNYNLRAEMNQSAYGALVNGQTVCAGYARAFQYLLQQLGIPCYYCTGYAGENHAWNIVELEDGYYNVDLTWDDTEGGAYAYFNKTDQDYADTHVRQELAVYLPPCNGQRYRDQPPTSAQGGMQGRRSLEETGMSETDILYSISDYYNNCYNQIMAIGRGNYEFSNVIEGQTLAQEVDAAYRNEGYKQGYLEPVMEAVLASSCEMDLRIEELTGDRYLVTHTVRLK
ncbi:hypothetical protein IMSAGC005_03329 [Lachnospiraceae bacterium]|nr:hypothetical protein IMSAGC005_03329 [Lachnospiraceae bacterium]